jgi:hypothetical protein
MSKPSFKSKYGSRFDPGQPNPPTLLAARKENRRVYGKKKKRQDAERKWKQGKYRYIITTSHPWKKWNQ